MNWGLKGDFLVWYSNTGQSRMIRKWANRAMQDTMCQIKLTPRKEWKQGDGCLWIQPKATSNKSQERTKLSYCAIVLINSLKVSRCFYHSQSIKTQTTDIGQDVSHYLNWCGGYLTPPGIIHWLHSVSSSHHLYALTYFIFYFLKSIYVFGRQSFPLFPSVSASLWK